MPVYSLHVDSIMIRFRYTILRFWKKTPALFAANGTQDTRQVGLLIRSFSAGVCPDSPQAPCALSALAFCLVLPCLSPSYWLRIVDHVTKLDRTSGQYASLKAMLIECTL